MKKIVQAIGIMMFALGVSLADSEMLIIPVALMAMGMLILYATERSE